MKKGSWGWEIVGKLILLLIIVLVLLVIIGLITGKTNDIWDKLKSIVTFRF